ncbi:MAG TPA: acyl-CoA desaturase [Streptosporangiaceae bacterium]|jgi:stearoyl-CoA desaturase (delta-9 desaturase)
MTTTADATPRSSVVAPAPASGPARGRSDFEANGFKLGQRILIGVFVGVPMLALVAAIPLAWQRGLISWLDVVLAVIFYYVSGLGISVGFHRYFTHGSFKARRGFKIALGIAGSMAVEGPLLNWVADHRRHHKYSDKEGDPHSPWRFGDDWKALTKGLLFAHMGWMFDATRTSRRKYCPDWLADSDIRRVSGLFGPLVAASLLLPALIGGLWTWSWQGAVLAFFWAGLVRISFLHHVTWSINSICHTFGAENFEVRDKSRNVAWLAILSFGESWHNLHHADPTCARHGVLKGQVDTAARVIWAAERLGWVYDVRWPDETRLTGKQVGRSRKLGGMTRRARRELIG